jgi:hypothetical protein
MMLSKLVRHSFSGDHARGLRRGSHAFIALMALGAAACGNSETLSAPLPGSIVVTTTTSGFLQDDSYQLLVNGESKGTIGANDEMTVSELDPATYDVALGDLAANCDVQDISVTVESNSSASASLDISCAFDQPTSYTVQFNRERPDLDTGDVTVCPFGICSTTDAWDLWVTYSSSTGSTVIHQNQTNAVEIAHLPGVTLQDLTEEDYAGATFTTNAVSDAFTDRVILIRTDVGNVYALGNPVVDGTASTLTFDAALIDTP